jgi:hypothetical protein
MHATLLWLNARDRDPRPKKYFSASIVVGSRGEADVHLREICRTCAGHSAVGSGESGSMIPNCAGTRA